MISATPPLRRGARRSTATASSRAGEVSTISPSRSNARPPAATTDAALGARRNCGSASASRNSLATSSSGCGGKLVGRSCHRASGTAAPAPREARGSFRRDATSPVKPAERSTRSASAGERSPARAKLDIDRVGRRSRARPTIGQCRADHFAEHLADFRRSREIARPRRAGRGSRNNKRCRLP